MVRFRFWPWVVVLALTVLVTACGRGAPATETPAEGDHPLSRPTSADAEPSPTPTPTATPTPEPVAPVAFRLPFDPADLQAVAYRAQLRVQLHRGADDSKPLVVHHVKYTAVNDFDVLKPQHFWLPPEYRGDDFLMMFGTEQKSGDASTPWNFVFNQGKGVWMDAHQDVAWQPLANQEQARWLLHHYLLREIGRLEPQQLVWYADGEEERAGVPARRYRLVVQDRALLEGLWSLPWFYDAQEKQLWAGQTVWDETPQLTAWIGPNDMLLGLEVRLQGTFTSGSGDAWPVTLTLDYQVEEVRATADAGEFIGVPRTTYNSELVLPPPKKPVFVPSDLLDSTSYIGNPITGLVWIVESLQITTDDAREIFGIYANLAHELGYGVDGPVFEDLEHDALGQMRVTDSKGLAWHIIIYPDSLQVIQPPGADILVGQDLNFFNGTMLNQFLCLYGHGFPTLEQTCVLEADKVCTEDEILAGQCAGLVFPESAWQPPGSMACLAAYGQIAQADAGWECRFAANAACELQAYLSGECPIGGDALQALAVGEGQYTISVEEHLEPGQAAFYRLPQLDAFPPVIEEALDPVVGGERPREILALGIEIDTEATDVQLFVYDPDTRELISRESSQGRMLWVWFGGGLLEVRSGSTAVDYTLRVVAAAWLGQGNIPMQVRDVMDDSGARYYIRPKPYSTLQVRVSGPGVTMDIYERPSSEQAGEPRLLVRGQTSALLGSEPADVLIVVHGPPKTPYTLYTLQTFVGGP